MEVVPFKARIWKQGNSHVVTIPKTYIENGILKEGEEVKFTVEVSA